MQRLTAIKTLLATPEAIQLLGNEDERKTAIDSSLVCKLVALEQTKTVLIEQLGKPQREYEEYRRQHGVWAQRSTELRGTPENPATGSLLFLQAESKRIENEYPLTLSELRAARDLISRKVFESKRALTQFYDGVKSAIEGEIAKHRYDLGDYAISIEAELSFESEFFDAFFRFVAQNKSGTFYGRDDGRAALQRLAAGVDDWEKYDQVAAFLTRIGDALQYDRRAGADSDRSAIEPQLRERRTVTEL